MNDSYFLDGFEKQAFKYSAGKALINAMGGKGAASGFRRAALNSNTGSESFLLDAITLPFGKKFEEKVQKKTWQYISKPALKADTWVGSKIQKVPGMKGLFTSKEQIPLGGGLHRDVKRSSALAPLVKARNLAVPIFAGAGMDKAFRSLTGKNNEQPGDYDMIDQNLQKTAQIIQDAELREKVASTMLQLNSKNKEHEKRAQATKLLYKQAELGIASLPLTYDEYEQKLASLQRQDLAVLEKALELTAGDVKLGELSGSDSFSFDAAATFQSDVLS